MDENNIHRKLEEIASETISYLIQRLDDKELGNSPHQASHILAIVEVMCASFMRECSSNQIEFQSMVAQLSSNLVLYGSKMDFTQ